MGLGTRLTPTLTRFIERQKLFFVATAADTGRVNLSPKGADALRVKGPNLIRWLNLSGSGNETAGHLKKVNRMTLMFCAFEGEPLILRTYGTATMLHPRDDAWEEAAAEFPEMAGSRQIFDLSIDTVLTSCGTGVPLMEFKADRVEDELVPYFGDMGSDGVEAYWRRKNVETLDGFPTGLFDD